MEWERYKLEKECSRLKEQLASRPYEPAADESSAPNKREFEQLQVKAYQFENAHKIAQEENKQLEKHICNLKKEFRESQDQFKSQQKKLGYFQKMLDGNEELDAATLLQQFKVKYPKSQVTLKDIEVLIDLSPSMVSPITSAQLPDLLEIREQVLLKHPANEKLYQHAFKVLNAFIEAVEKSTGDYSHLQRLLGEIDRQKLYY